MPWFAGIAAAAGLSGGARFLWGNHAATGTCRPIYREVMPIWSVLGTAFNFCGAASGAAGMLGAPVHGDHRDGAGLRHRPFPERIFNPMVIGGLLAGASRGATLEEM